MLAFELIYEVVDETIVEVLTTQVSITGSGLDLEDAVLDGEEGDIEGTTTEIVDEDVPLLGRLTGTKTVGNGLIGVDGLARLLAVEEVGDELLDLRDTSGTTDEDDLVDGGLVDLGVAEDTLDGLHGGAEEVLAELLETGTGNAGVEINTLVKGVDLDGGLGGGRKSALGPLASGAEAAESTSIGGQILLPKLAVSK